MRSPMIESATYIEDADKANYTDMKVLKSQAGFYVGTMYANRAPDGEVLFEEPGSRDSGYFESETRAEGCLKLLEAGVAAPLRGHPTS